MENEICSTKKTCGRAKQFNTIYKLYLASKLQNSKSRIRALNLLTLVFAAACLTNATKIKTPTTKTLQIAQYATRFYSPIRYCLFNFCARSRACCSRANLTYPSARPMLNQ